MSTPIIGPFAQQRSIALPSALDAHVDRTARRLAAEWGEPLWAVRRLVEHAALSRGLRSIESELGQRRCA
jgi:hypothetical protein